MEEVRSCYIHIPFCSNICSYCDFCKFYYQDTLVDEYLDILLKEINDRYQNEELETIYIGGGTPSALNVKQLEKLFLGLNKLKRASNLEFTIECNVLDLCREKLELFKRFGVNRLSVGVQSFDNKILDFLERGYTEKEIENRISLAKEYFDNINIDLIYAVPGETLDVLKRDLELFLALDVTHISTYSLMIEDHTKLGIKKVNTISEELDRNMYDMIHDVLKENGFIHYEVSNFSKVGYESKHNLTYWKNKRYYGFGLGASGYLDLVRYTNTRNVKKYLSGNYTSEEEKITPLLDASNYAILGLRTIYGVNKKQFQDLFKCDFISYFSVSDLVDSNILIETNDSYILDFKYWYVSNEILSRFV